MGSNPCRKNFLLGITHLVVGKYFQVLEVHRELRQVQEFSYEKRLDYGLFKYFVIFWIEYQVLHM